MNRAVFLKALRDSLLLLLIITLVVTAWEVIFLSAIHDISPDLGGQLLKLKSAQRFLRLFIGADFADNISATSLVTIGFAHPLLLALTWTLILTICTRVIVGEIDRGTADMLLALPVSRASHYVSVTCAWLVACAPVSYAPLLGLAIGIRWFPLTHLFPGEALDFPRLALLPPNLAAMFIAVGGVSMLVSSFFSRRGAAIGVLLAGLLGSVLLQFLGQISEGARQIASIGVLAYYRPLPVVRTGEAPWRDIAILLIVGLVAWLGGLARYVRRDIPSST